MELTRIQPGDKAPARDRYEVVDRFGERLNVTVLCEQGERLPRLGVAGFNPVSYVRASELTVGSKSPTS